MRRVSPIKDALMFCVLATFIIGISVALLVLVSSERSSFK